MPLDSAACNAYVTDMPDLIGTKEACRLLDIHPATLHRWIDRGRIVPVTKLPSANGPYLFNRADVERLLTDAEEVAS